MTLGYDGTLCSLSVWRPDQPLVPKERLTRPHAKVFADPPLTEGTNFVDRSMLLDPFVDADDIDWKDNPFERAEQENIESPDELLAMIQFESSPWLQEQLRVPCREFISNFSTSVRKDPARVEPMTIDVDRTKWAAPRNRLSPRRHSKEKQRAIRSQVDALLRLGVIKESRVTEWSQVHLAFYARLCSAQPCYVRFGRLAHSEHLVDDLEDRVVETESVWSFGLHYRISSDTLASGLSAPDCLYYGTGIIPVDSGSHGTERSWPLLST